MRALWPNFSRQVAIKRILPGYSRDPHFRRMFTDEAQLSSCLVHSNIVSVLDFGFPVDDVKIWLGIITLMVVEIGLITPPVGLNVFVINSLARDVPMIDTFRGVVPFLMSDMVRLTLVVVFPIVTLILPALLGR